VLQDGHWYGEVLMSILDHEWAARLSTTSGRPADPREGDRKALSTLA
jgi:hypothetical protein